jgi:hypothetical protein
MTSRAASKYGWMTVYLIRRLKLTCSQLSISFSSNAKKYGLELPANKCMLFATKVRYSGRSITKDGVRLDSKNTEALQTIREPQNGAVLEQYVAAFQPDAKGDTQLFGACGPSSSSTGESVRGVLPPGPI